MSAFDKRVTCVCLLFLFCFVLFKGVFLNGNFVNLVVLIKVLVCISSFHLKIFYFLLAGIYLCEQELFLFLFLFFVKRKEINLDIRYLTN